MKNFVLPPLYPITDAAISNLPHSVQVEKLIAGGAKLIQLREKNAGAKDFLEQAVRAVETARSHGVKILINDRVDIALAAKADGVHLGQTDLPAHAARQILGDAAIIGVSTHGAAQAIAALRLPIDYIAVGAIFATTTKENPEAVLGLENLRLIRAAVNDFPLVAIGGINEKNARRCLAAGADSVAVISALLKNSAAISETTENFLASLTA